MLSFSHFRERPFLFQPRTPAAALRAVTAGIGHVEELVYQGTSIKPLVEEPYDLLELQRILSRQELDLDTSLLLVRIFAAMLGDPDPERALFAAEGITTVETRYAKRIDQLKAELAEGESFAVRLELASRYRELALLNEKSPSIRTFYLREAFLSVRSQLAAPRLPTELLRVTVGILAALGLHRQSEALLRKAEHSLDPTVLFLRAETAFSMRHYRTVSVILRHLAKSYNRLPERMRMAIDQWRGDEEVSAEGSEDAEAGPPRLGGTGG